MNFFQENIASFKLLWLYFITTIPLTICTIGLYFFWLRKEHAKHFSPDAQSQHSDRHSDISTRSWAWKEDLERQWSGQDDPKNKTRVISVRPIVENKIGDIQTNLPNVTPSIGFWAGRNRRQ